MEEKDCMVVVFVAATNALVIKIFRSPSLICVTKSHGHKDISTQWIESFSGGRRVQSKCSAAGLARARDLLVFGEGHPISSFTIDDDAAPCFMMMPILHESIQLLKPTMSDEPPQKRSKADSITIRRPDDFHHHCRDGTSTASVLKHAVPRFTRCLMMPNLKPPVTTVDMAVEYKKRILASMPENPSHATFQPLMTLYLTDKTSPDEIKKAATLKNDDGTPTVVGCKYYPAGATTNSDLGVTDFKNLYPVLEAMQEVGMMLCIHSEVTHADIFEREPVFIEEIMKPLVGDFPNLKITMEHISTKEAVDYVLSAPDNVKASITPHHLIYNRNHMLAGGIRPHLYCLPILKAEVHREALVAAATSGSPKFFMGTDSAPHATHTKEAACGCAGVFSAHCCIEIYTQVFDQEDKLDLLEDFTSSFGADHYGLPRSTETITLERKVWTVPNTYEFGEHTVTPLKAGEEVCWKIVGIE